MYVLIWEFIVKPGFEAEFEQVNGPEGGWAKLFEQANGYIKSEVFHDSTQNRRFLTIDYWDSEKNFEEFLQNYADIYKYLDEKLAHLTEKETKIGSFEFVLSPIFN